jgi:membrane-bound metal-dependent hydrolase YbcI (DUF457 family)
MPLPVAHSLLGATFASSLVPADEPNRMRILLLCALVSIVPDFDFLPIVLFDIDRSFHRGFSHSIFFAIVVGATIFLFIGRQRWREGLLYTIAMLSHGLLDALTAVNGQGVALLWPLTDDRFKLSVIPLFEISYSTPARSIFVKLAIETFVFGVLFWLSTKIRQIQSSRNPV